MDHMRVDLERCVSLHRVGDADKQGVQVTAQPEMNGADTKQSNRDDNVKPECVKLKGSSFHRQRMAVARKRRGPRNERVPSCRRLTRNEL